MRNVSISPDGTLKVIEGELGEGPMIMMFD
jgi:hypothetical protein